MYLGMLIPTLLSIIFFFQFFWMNKSEKRSIKQLEDVKKRTTICINAIVDDIVYKSIRVTSNSDRNTYYYAVYKFIFNENEYRIKSDVSISRNLMTIGEIVQIYINPNNINEIYVPKENPYYTVHILHIMKILMIISSIFCLVLGIVVTLLFVLKVI